MKREELIWEWSDTLDAGFKVYDMAQANEVMDELEKRIKELEEQFENVQSSTYAENVDTSIALIKANERIKELEAENARLKAQVPKWISILDNPNHPLNKDFLVAWLGKSTDTGFKDMAIRHSVELTNDFTHWMLLPPPPPTTEESSATEKEACDAET